MYSINRNAIVIKPKQPFLDWLLDIQPESGLTLQEVRHDSLVFLIPPFDKEADAVRYLEWHYAEYFELLLDEWNADKSTWPEKKDFILFKEWFDVYLHSLLIDTTEDQVVKEDYL